MSDVAGWLKTHKPVVAGAAAVLVVVAYMAHRRNVAAAAAGPADPGAPGSTAGALTDNGGEYLVPYSGSGMDGSNLITALQRLRSTAGTTTGATTPPNNNTWEAQAVAWLTGAGYDALTSQRALDTYLHGGTITHTQSVELNAAIKQLGLPPAGAPTPKVLPARTGALVYQWLHRPKPTPRAEPPAQQPRHFPILADARAHRAGTLKILQQIAANNPAPAGGWPVAHPG